MIKAKKDILAFLLYAIIFGFILFWSNRLFLWAFDKNSNFLVSGTAAFLGAFLAFLFVRLGDFLSKVYTREVMHYNSLVTLGTELNELIGMIDSNLYLMPNFKKAIKEGNIYWSRLRILPINKTHLNELYDINLINKVFEFNHEVRSLNNDIENLMEGYNDLKNAFINKHIAVEHYVQNAVLISKQIDLLEKFLTDLSNKVQVLFARVRLQQEKDKPLGTKIMEFFIHTSGSKITQKEINKEVNKLKKELADSRAKSKREIDAILKK